MDVVWKKMYISFTCNKTKAINKIVVFSSWQNGLINLNKSNEKVF